MKQSRAQDRLVEQYGNPRGGDIETETRGEESHAQVQERSNIR